MFKLANSFISNVQLSFYLELNQLKEMFAFKIVHNQKKKLSLSQRKLWNFLLALGLLNSEVWARNGLDSFRKILKILLFVNLYVCMCTYTSMHIMYSHKFCWICINKTSRSNWNNIWCFSWETCGYQTY